VDFSSALYLGMRHGSRDFPAWRSFTTGVPAALEETAAADAVARRLAALQGCEAATLLPSTLHLFWDLFGVLARDISEVLMDAGAYPISRWGAERAAGLGVPVRSFRHHAPAALRRALERSTRHRGGDGRPVVLADGFCPGCGQPTPLREYLEAVRQYGGMLVVDDTQALGIFGSPAIEAPYGRGGGGSLRRLSIAGPDVLLGCSLAKGFGVPVAALSGAREAIRSFRARSRTRVHCSPPSIPVVHAAAHALGLNHKQGDALRAELAQRVSRLRRGFRENGLRLVGGLFPVQTLPASGRIDAAALHAHLQARGIQTVLHRARRGSPPLVSFVVNATHSTDDIDRAAAAVAEVARPNATGSRRCTNEPILQHAAPT
jgi:8-amino-7-oxononanoate synthase